MTFASVNISFIQTVRFSNVSTPKTFKKLKNIDLNILKIYFNKKTI